MKAPSRPKEQLIPFEGWRIAAVRMKDRQLNKWEGFEVVQKWLFGPALKGLLGVGPLYYRKILSSKNK